MNTEVPTLSQSRFVRPPHVDQILVVDDSPDNSFLVQAILEEEGYRVEIADNGAMALAKIEAAPPDLVLLDVMMPGMDGYEVTRRIRENQNLPFIPILLITAYDQPSVARGLDTGADDFIRKPVEFDELLARVRSLLRLKHSVDERDQIARQREDFVSRLAHDLRTPLVAADRMMNLFLQGALGDLSEDMRYAIVTMARSNQNLLTMVNTLLEVYRFDAGNKNMNFLPVDLIELVEDVTRELTPLAAEKGLQLQIESEALVASGLKQVSSDRLELRRVLMNLIENAIKFTDTGSVKVRLLPTPQVPHSITVQVEDTGMGIPLEDQPTIFERFRQGSHRRYGSGLGLYLSRRIVEAHGGTIAVRSTPGQGSVFTAQLPAVH